LRTESRRRSDTLELSEPDFNFLTEVEAILLDGHFILEHGARSRAGYFFNFNGTAGVLRVSMIDDAAGGSMTRSQRFDLSYRAQIKGWKFVYLPDWNARRSCRSRSMASRCSSSAGLRA